jgi:Arc/MetJ-type ribon-helix-helix transcriptional regulator
MTDIERMIVVFPEPMAQQLRAAVEAGEYASTSEAVRDAVRLWGDHRELRQREIEMQPRLGRRQSQRFGRPPEDGRRDCGGESGKSR